MPDELCGRAAGERLGGRAACGVRVSCAGELCGRAAGERDVMDVCVCVA